jgi:hypothetical protein
MKWGEFHLQEIQFLQFIIPPLDESWGYIGILMSVRHTFGFRIIIKIPLNQIFSDFHTLLCTINIQYTYIVGKYKIYLYEL